MTLEDEIEFFGFVPQYLLRTIEEKMLETCKDSPEQIKAIEHNYRIFEEFVLQNCFDFPEGFSIERKLVDDRIPNNLRNDIQEYTKLLEEVKYVEMEMARLNHENTEMLERIDELRKIKHRMSSMQSDMDSCKKTLERLDRLEQMEREAGNIAVNPNESTLTVLLDDEKFKKEIEKQEKEEFLGIYDISNIDGVLDGLKKNVERK